MNGKEATDRVEKSRLGLDAIAESRCHSCGLSPGAQTSALPLAHTSRVNTPSPWQHEVNPLMHQNLPSNIYHRAAVILTVCSCF